MATGFHQSPGYTSGSLRTAVTTGLQLSPGHELNPQQHAATGLQQSPGRVLSSAAMRSEEFLGHVDALSGGSRFSGPNRPRRSSTPTIPEGDHKRLHKLPKKPPLVHRRRRRSSKYGANATFQGSVKSEQHARNHVAYVEVPTECNAGDLVRMELHLNFSCRDGPTAVTELSVTRSQARRFCRYVGAKCEFRNIKQHQVSAMRVVEASAKSAELSSLKDDELLLSNASELHASLSPNMSNTQQSHQTSRDIPANESPASGKDPAPAVLGNQVSRAFVEVPIDGSDKHPTRTKSDLEPVHRANVNASAMEHQSDTIEKGDEPDKTDHASFRSILDKKPSSAGAQINAKQLVLWCLPSAVTASVCLMIPSRQNGRLPPQWGPEKSQYPYHEWARDVLLWSIMSDWDASRKAAAVLSQLTGSAQEFARQIPPRALIAGGAINGVQVDALTWVMHELAVRYARLSEEVRISSLSELFEFRAHAGEKIDMLLDRFDTVRARAAEQGRLTVSWEGLSWILVKAVGISDNQLVQILQPYQGVLPSNQGQFDQLRLSLRRMGHILENYPGNLAQSVRNRNGASGHSAYAIIPDREPQHDELAHAWYSRNPAPAAPTRSYQPDWHQDELSYPLPSTRRAEDRTTHPSSFAAFADDSGTDTDTSSDASDAWDHSHSGLTEQEADDRAQQLYWAYARAKQQWRSFMGKPTRRVRRHVKRSFHSKGSPWRKGKGKAGHINKTSLLASLSEDEVQSLFPAAKGKGWRKSSGKGGKGRRTGNPKGPDGNPMKCHQCGSDQHLVARCPRRSSEPPALFIRRAQQPLSPLLSTTPQSPPNPGDVMPTSILMVGPGASEAGSAGSWSQVDPWLTAQPTPIPTQSTVTDPWSHYQPPQGPPMSYGPIPTSSRPPAHPAHSGAHQAHSAAQQAQSAHHQGRDVHHLLHQFHRHGSAAASLNVTPVQFPLHPEARSAPPAGTPLPQHEPLPTQSMPSSETPQHGHPPLPELPAWAYLPGMEFLHGASQTVPSYISPYQVSVTSALDSFGLQDIEHFHVVSQLQSQRADDRQSSVTATRLLDDIQSSDLTMWHDVQGDLLSRNRSNRSREREELEDRVQRALRQREDEAVEMSTRRERGSSSRNSERSQATPRSESRRPSVVYMGDQNQCAICQNEYSHGDELVRLICRHSFHQGCWSELSIRAMQDEDPSCPCCRGGGRVIAVYRHIGSDRFQDAEPGPDEPTAHDETHMPWWPLPKQEGVAYHSSTQLPGHSCIIVDPGAFTNLMGSNWAVSQATKARNAGGHSYTTRLVQPMVIKGVGNGTQQCQDVTTIPVSIVVREGQSAEAGDSLRSFTFEAPVVGGEGCDLPALLGLKSLLSKNAVLQMTPGAEYLTFPGPGGYHTEWSPGTIHIPLDRAPSGHLVIRSDRFGSSVASGHRDVLPSVLQVTTHQTQEAERRKHAVSP